MRLSTIFQALADGELANLRIGDYKFDIADDDKPRILKSINLGLNELYTRFMLSIIHKEIPLVTNQEIYTITDENLLEILSVGLNECELSYRNDYTLTSINTLVLSKELNIKTNDKLKVKYKAKHKALTEQDITDDTDISLPISYLNALLYFIASRLYTSINNQLDGDLNEGMRWTQRYHEELSMLEQQGIDVDGIDENNWFNQRGFV